MIITFFKEMIMPFNGWWSGIGNFYPLHTGRFTGGTPIFYQPGTSYFVGSPADRKNHVIILIHNIAFTVRTKHVPFRQIHRVSWAIRYLIPDAWGREMMRIIGFGCRAILCRVRMPVTISSGIKPLIRPKNIFVSSC